MLRPFRLPSGWAFAGHAWALAVALLAMPVGQARARLIEEQVRVPVTVVDLYRKTVSQEIVVTVFRDARATRAPYLILHHGRAVNEQANLAYGRVRYSAAARYFVAKGFAVLVPTRIGYGVSGGSDVEFSGNCSDHRHLPGYQVAADQSRQVLAHFSRADFLDPSQGLVVGQSYGGATSVILAAQGLDGLVAALNFAGGGGGNPESRPENPCRADLLEKIFETAGKSSLVPVYSFYSANDRFWGERLPREWFSAFLRAGGRGEFIALPAHGTDGHGVFTAAPALWQPAVDRILASLPLRLTPLPAPPTAPVPPPSGFARLDDVTALPHVQDGGRKGYEAFLASPAPRAFVLNENGRWAWSSTPDDPLGDALGRCNQGARSPCQPYAVDAAVVWRVR
jgi:dienelactone hydrolase